MPYWYWVSARPFTDTGPAQAKPLAGWSYRSYLIWTSLECLAELVMVYNRKVNASNPDASIGGLEEQARHKRADHINPDRGETDDAALRRLSGEHLVRRAETRMGVAA